VGKGKVSVPTVLGVDAAAVAAAQAAEKAAREPAAASLRAGRLPRGPFPRPLAGAPDVHWLGPGGIAMVGTLTVAYLSPGPAEGAGLEMLQKLGGKGVFLGADLLLTPEWPAGEHRARSWCVCVCVRAGVCVRG